MLKIVAFFAALVFMILSVGIFKLTDIEVIEEIIQEDRASGVPEAYEVTVEEIQSFGWFVASVCGAIAVFCAGLGYLNWD